ncbi:hypothetical protein EPYR_03843 [Erwinia pyrifoliae DSM 12163]|nr:hypothetical protein EPYR_03843 [Erwinia pyrifoliae DSM 12163]
MALLAIAYRLSMMSSGCKRGAAAPGTSQAAQPYARMVPVDRGLRGQRADKQWQHKHQRPQLAAGGHPFCIESTTVANPLFVIKPDNT